MTLARAVAAAIRGCGVWAIIFGFIIVLGGEQRMAAPSFAVIRGVAEVVHGSPAHVWGISLAASGLLVIMPRTELVGLLLVSTWCVLFGMGALAAAVADPTAAVTGPCVYFYVGLMLAGLIAVRRAGLVPPARSLR